MEYASGCVLCIQTSRYDHESPEKSVDRQPFPWSQFIEDSSGYSYGCHWRLVWYIMQMQGSRLKCNWYIFFLLKLFALSNHERVPKHYNTYLIYKTLAGSVTENLVVKVTENYADHPLVLGPRYQPKDIKLAWAHQLDKNISGKWGLLIYLYIYFLYHFFFFNTLCKQSQFILILLNHNLLN